MADHEVAPQIKGVIIQIIPNKGFGFIRGDDDYTRYFHAKDVIPIRAFDKMFIGQRVKFTPIDLSPDGEKRNNGLRGVQVEVDSESK